MKTHRPFQAVAVFMGIYHMILGVLGLVSGDVAAKLGAVVYGASVQVTPVFSYMAKYLAAYVFAFGVMMLIMASDPVKYRKFVYVALVVAVIRILSRLIFADELRAAFGIGMTSSLETIALVAVLNLALFILAPKEG